MIPYFEQDYSISPSTALYLLSVLNVAFYFRFFRISEYFLPPAFDSFHCGACF